MVLLADLKIPIRCGLLRRQRRLLELLFGHDYLLGFILLLAVKRLRSVLALFEALIQVVLHLLVLELLASLRAPGRLWLQVRELTHHYRLALNAIVVHMSAS